MAERRILRLEATGSTNADLAALAEAGAPSGTVVIAETQAGGRGRLGRSWQSPPGLNLYFSLLIRPVEAARAPLSTLATAVALAETLDLWIKWPNDVLDDDGRKICGILAELHGDAVVLGVGVNVNQVEFPPELPNAGSLARLRGPRDREAIFQALIPAIEAAVADPRILERWRSRARLGPVKVDGRAAVAVGIRDDGALLLEGGDVVLAGDVELVRRSEA